MGKTVPGIRITENKDDLIIKIDKELLVKEFENHPKIIFEHYSENKIQQVKIKEINSFIEKLKYLMISDKSDTEISWIGTLMDEAIMYLWNEGYADFIEECNEAGWKGVEPI
ncbi:hypothetical protein [Cytobacillus massiliigabonensis]|uniref:hypothetical protein n=1 Tax=Cytobacillus massiliigabonensis TaxID=1871011 RepID=UPI000C845188|nr:hypothetical protein [Cytobacillus massiliigabonensis]